MNDVGSCNDCSHLLLLRTTNELLILRILVPVVAHAGARGVAGVADIARVLPF
jgi:hypothetical protein